MFATLIGTNTEKTAYREIFEGLYDIAIGRGYVPPDFPMRVQPDGPLDGWSLEQKGPRDKKADFILAVTAPNVPGISPIFPAFMPISGPLFAVVVMDSFFVVSRADKRDVSEFKDRKSVTNEFEDFLDTIRNEPTADEEQKNKNTNIQPIDAGDDVKIGKERLCSICKKRPGKIEHRISPPMKVVEVCICDECSPNVVY
ncbi:MAG: hypothetical protein ACE5H1_08320 [Thermodesulfobacteriota bacterium]